MELEIILKQDNIPAFDKKAIKLKHIGYYPDYDGSYEEDEITEELVSHILKQIPEGINVIFSLIPYGEEDTFEIICDGVWLAIGYSSYNDGEEQVYYSYNPAYAGTDELSPLESGGQSPVEKYLAINDIGAGVKAAEYFIRTGKLYPGIIWAKQL